MATISPTIKTSKNFLSYNTYDDTFIKSFDEALVSIKPGDYVYVEINTLSSIIKVRRVNNYYKGLAFNYDFMVNRFDRLYKDSWCYSDYCRLATTDEIKLIQKKIKNFKNKKI